MKELIDRAAILSEAKRLAGPQTGDGWDNWGVYALIERQPTIEAVPLDNLCEWLAKQDYEIYCFMCQEAFDAGGGCPNQVSDSQWRCGGKEHWKAFLKKVMEGWDGDVH